LDKDAVQLTCVSNTDKGRVASDARHNEDAMTGAVDHEVGQGRCKDAVKWHERVHDKFVHVVVHYSPMQKVAICKPQLVTGLIPGNTTQYSPHPRFTPRHCHPWRSQPPDCGHKRLALRDLNGKGWSRPIAGQEKQIYVPPHYCT
jgi:hypothetical protein